MELNEINKDLPINFKISKNKELLYPTDDTNIIGRSFTLASEGVSNIKYNDIVFNLANGTIWSHGVFFGDSTSCVSKEEFDPIKNAYLNHINKGSLGTINGQSIEDGNNVTLDLSLYKIVSELPTENILDNKIYIVPSVVDGKNVLTEYVYANGEWDVFGIYKDEIDLSGYLKTADAEKKYMKLSNGGGATISVNNTGSMSNFGPNAQAFNAVRDCGSNSITGKSINAGAFGVKLDGTTAFSHKTYDTFNQATGSYTGAKNTAVLTFSGASGLRYAKNTGTSNDVTNDMYKYVGVIGSPDENQKVYSAKEVDTFIKGLQDQIDALKAQLNA